MDLPLMNLVPPDLWENRTQESQPPDKEILKIKYNSYNKWTQVRLHHDPHLKTEKQKRKPIPIEEAGGTNPSFKSKPKWKCIIGTVSMFKQYLNQKRILHTCIQSTFITYLPVKYHTTPLLLFTKMILTVHLK